MLCVPLEVNPFGPNLTRKARWLSCGLVMSALVSALPFGNVEDITVI